MTYKVKFGLCKDCSDGKEKAIVASRCLFHYKKFRMIALKIKKKNRQESPKHPVPKVKNVVIKPDTYSKDLGVWFNYFTINAIRICENCDASLSHYNDEDWFGSQHHILEKSKFPSVAGNLNNHMVLGKWCCHSQWHTSMLNASKMQCFYLAKHRVQKLLPKLTEAELNKVDPLFLN